MPDLEEDLLQHFLALRTVHQDAQDEAEDPWREQIVQAGEGALIARGDALEQLTGMVDGVGAVLRHLEPVYHHETSMP